MKVAVLVSGGVDSSVALSLLKQQGYDVTAFYIKIWLEDELASLGECPWEEDLAYVQKVCKQLDVPLQVVSLQKEYHDEVVAYTIAEVKAGRTPNPDILCNQRIKFGLFLDKIGSDFEKIATGHYASIKQENGKIQLLRSADPIKDQTYFLSYLSQKQLSRVLFPLGSLRKDQVRELARTFNLPNKDRKDSQGICFLGKLKFNDFLKYHLGESPGDLVEFETGKKLGEHRGFWYHTIGQRQGSGLAGGPWYVVAKDVNKNIVYISRTYYAPDKKRDTFEVSHCNWIAGIRPEKKRLQIKIRHGKHMYDGILDEGSGGSIRVKLASSDQGIAPGQFAVFYDDTLCLGAGMITDSLK